MSHAIMNPLKGAFVARSKNFQELLLKSLKDPKKAMAYLNAALDEYKDGDEESKKILLTALKDITEAQGGISKLSAKNGVHYSIRIMPKAA